MLVRNNCDSKGDSKESDNSSHSTSLISYLKWSDADPLVSQQAFLVILLKLLQVIVNKLASLWSV
jgi:hypothetical protein